MADVTITYDGETIAEMSASGSKTLLTAGKYCDDDIEVTYVKSGGGGGSTLGTKTITANGEYDATDDELDGYSQVTVSVPNTYTQSDEGKVVNNGALVAQTAHADVTPTTSDQTIDTTLNNSLKVKGDADLVASNIKKDVEIFGVTGSYEGSGGAGYATGTITPTERTATITFDTGLTTIHGLAVVPTSESPLKSGGRTAYAYMAFPDVFLLSAVIGSNQAGSGMANPNLSGSSTRFTQSGTEVTITLTPTSSTGLFETISYTWYAW